MSSQSVHTERKYSPEDFTNLLKFLAKYHNQLKTFKLSIVQDGKKVFWMDKKLLWNRFCKINEVSKDFKKWSANDTAKLSSMDYETLYRSMLDAFGSVTREMV